MTAIKVTGALKPRYEDILSQEALAFLEALHKKFNATRLALLQARADRQKSFDQGALPDFLAETKSVREASWTVAPLPHDLLDRRVEITGPVDKKMIINALNSGANAFMADFEDATAPTWANLVEGQANLKDRWAGTLVHEAGGKRYELGPSPAVLMVRPRGWHLPEAHVRIDGAPMSGSLLDFEIGRAHV